MKNALTLLAVILAVLVLFRLAGVITHYLIVFGLPCLLVYCLWLYLKGRNG